MRKIQFKLTNPVCITPMSGNTEVEVATTGSVLIREHGSGEKRLPSIHLADTECGHLTISPMGVNTTVHIVLPTVKATESEFMRQMHLLFKLHRLTQC